MRDFLSFERRLDANHVKTMINIRVVMGERGFAGREIREGEINEAAVEEVRRNFNDHNERARTLQRIYQSITGGF